MAEKQYAKRGRGRHEEACAALSKHFSTSKGDGLNSSTFKDDKAKTFIRIFIMKGCFRSLRKPFPRDFPESIFESLLQIKQNPDLNSNKKANLYREILSTQPEVISKIKNILLIKNDWPDHLCKILKIKHISEETSKIADCSSLLQYIFEIVSQGINKKEAEENLKSQKATFVHPVYIKEKDDFEDFSKNLETINEYWSGPENNYEACPATEDPLAATFGDFDPQISDSNDLCGALCSDFFSMRDRKKTTAPNLLLNPS